MIEPEKMREKIEYFHNNPVKRGLVILVTEWELSSYRDMMGLREPWIELDRSWC